MLTLSDQGIYILKFDLSYWLVFYNNDYIIIYGNPKQYCIVACFFGGDIICLFHVEDLNNHDIQPYSLTNFLGGLNTNTIAIDQ